MKNTLPIYQIDAFASDIFKGNPAAVCPLEEWLPTETMQAIAMENNLSETAFLLRNDDGSYSIRWFTPSYEVPICGHATLASAYVVCEILEKRNEVTFRAEQQDLSVTYDGEFFTMVFPQEKITAINIPDEFVKALSETVVEVYSGWRFVVVLENEAAVRNIQIDPLTLSGLEDDRMIITAPGDNSDYVQRYFIPSENRFEDPVTGSALCLTLPYWHDKFQKDQYHIQQLSKRGGNLWGKVVGENIEISGQARCYLQGEVIIN